jgi:hypothetical protein
MYIQSATFLLDLLLDLQAGQLAPNHHVGNSCIETFGGCYLTAVFGISLGMLMPLNVP